MKNKDLFSLKNKTVLITGGFGLVGKTLVESLLDQEATVCLLDIKEDAKQLAQFRERSERIRFYPGDITDQTAIETVVGKISQENGRIDVLINNAYPRNESYGQVFEKIKLSDWEENTHSHLGGYFNMAQQAAKQMMKQKSGSIINICSIYGMVGPDFSVYEGTKMTMPAEYAAIKGGLINLTRYLATYLGHYGIRANAVSPGGILNGQDPRFVENYKKKVPLGRMAAPEDLSGAVIFLASDASQYVTGQNIAVDGGWTSW
jgi:NAD(P)-dependent dehydrogenase (short-subunit alcohol dehydrogenase family)